MSSQDKSNYLNLKINFKFNIACVDRIAKVKTQIEMKLLYVGAHSFFG